MALRKRKGSRLVEEANRLYEESLGRIRMVNYGENLYKSHVRLSPHDCQELTEEGNIHWINIVGYTDDDAPVVDRLGRWLGAKTIALEGMMDVSHRPKLEDIGTSFMVILKAVSQPSGGGEIVEEHVGLIVTGSSVMSISSAGDNLFNGVKEKIEVAESRFRSKGTDYLMYSLLSEVIDTYYPIVDNIAESIEGLEVSIIAGKSNNITVQSIYNHKTTLGKIYKNLWSMREVITELESASCIMVTDSVKPFMRDTHEHVSQLIEAVDIYRDTLAGLLDLHLSFIGQKTNEVMRVLAVVSTIFMPLTFIAGVYGMNFKVFPELQWEYGYLLWFWGIIITIAAFCIYLFKKKKWF